jgi:hypothetical protein
MAQFARPTSDVNVASWTTSPLWSKIDETVADDLDFIQSDLVAFGNISTTAEIQLGAISDPVVNTGHVLRARCAVGFGDGLDVVQVDLFAGATSIATLFFSSISASTFQDASLTLTAGQVASFRAAGGYANARIKCTYFSSPSDATGNPGGVSWAALEVPNAGPAINTQPQDAARDAGETATFTVTATASAGALHYQWKRAPRDSETFANVGTDSASYTTGTLSIDGDNGARFEVVVTDDNGSTTSSIAALTVGVDRNYLINDSFPVTLAAEFQADPGEGAWVINDSFPVSLGQTFTTPAAENAFGWMFLEAYEPMAVSGATGSGASRAGTSASSTSTKNATTSDVARVGASASGTGKKGASSTSAGAVGAGASETGKKGATSNQVGAVGAGASATTKKAATSASASRVGAAGSDTAAKGATAASSSAVGTSGASTSSAATTTPDAHFGSGASAVGAGAAASSTKAATSSSSAALGLSASSTSTAVTVAPATPPLVGGRRKRGRAGLAFIPNERPATFEIQRSEISQNYEIAPQHYEEEALASIELDGRAYASYASVDEAVTAFIAEAITTAELFASDDQADDLALAIAANAGAHGEDDWTDAVEVATDARTQLRRRVSPAQALAALRMLEEDEP